MISFYLQGLTLGLAYVAPIGMQNLFVINSALSQSWHRAMSTAMIVTFWDISLGLACFLGVGAIMETLPCLQEIILGIGGLFIFYIGMSLIHSKADLSNTQDLNRPLRNIALSAFVVTWAQSTSPDRWYTNARCFSCLPTAWGRLLLHRWIRLRQLSLVYHLIHCCPSPRK